MCWRCSPKLGGAWGNFRGGRGKRPKSTKKNKNSSDLTHYFCDFLFYSFRENRVPARRKIRGPKTDHPISPKWRFPPARHLACRNGFLRGACPHMHAIPCPTHRGTRCIILGGRAPFYWYFNPLRALNSGVPTWAGEPLLHGVSTH